jgi:endothelin-converting enzyme
VLNYGYLGSILGHELTHSFDNTGRKFDQDGNENMWWTNQTTNEYEKRTSCFIQHYESYTVPGIEEKVLKIKYFVFRTIIISIRIII